jgi:MoaA/NifB/PqqE/SkfB family radical SAM enzyme
VRRKVDRVQPGRSALDVVEKRVEREFSDHRREKKNQVGGEPAMSIPDFLWLEITGKCQLRCVHCYADSSPEGTHGTMTTADWRNVIDQSAALGVRSVQFIGGEPTLHPDLAELVEHALDAGLAVEVFTNLVKITPRLWDVFSRPGVALATSYYSDEAAGHAAVTGRDTYRQTTANLARAVRRGIPVRAGVIDTGDPQRADAARQHLVDLGIPRPGTDRERAVGRGADRAGSAAATGSAGTGDRGRAPALCGGCGDGVAAIGPDGTVTPCVFARWQPVGNVHDTSLQAIHRDLPTARKELVRQGMPGGGGGDDCPPKGNCYPYNCHPRG